MIVLDAEREALFVADWFKPGQVTMLRKGAGGKWVRGTLLDDPKLKIQSMCVLDANRLSLFDANSSALLIYEFA